MIKAEFYQQESDEKVRCTLCPKMCLISEHYTGVCRVRQNIKGELFAKSYFEVASINIDPMEKKPLYHFHPGRTVFSIGASGCNMKCNYCQNFQISQNNITEIAVSSDEIIRMTKENNAVGIAYTYTEPTVWYEFMYKMAEEAKNADLKNVIVTNGNINKAPLKKLIPLIDAANIDIKAFTQAHYSILKGDLQSVKNSIQLFLENNVHTEISCLIAPGFWDENTFDEMCRWLSNMNPFIPLHINRYFPAYISEAPATPIGTQIRFKNIADKYLKYAYIGNVNVDGASNTKCHHCGKLLIKRENYHTDIFISEPICLECETQLPIIL